MANTRSVSGLLGRIKRGGAISGATILVCGAASFFIPFVTLPIALVIGGVGGGAIVAATAKK